MVYIVFNRILSISYFDSLLLFYTFLAIIVIKYYDLKIKRGFVSTSSVIVV